MSKLQSVSSLIDARLKGIGMSKMEFAKKLNTQPSSVTKYLSGKHNFTIETLFKIEEVLRIEIIRREVVDFEIRKSHKHHSI